jgi:hypothetical protein
VAAGIHALQQGITRYTPNTGTTALRKAICKKLKGALQWTYVWLVTHLWLCWASKFGGGIWLVLGLGLGLAQP